MGAGILINSRVFAGAADLTGQSNKIDVDAAREKKNVTPFGTDGWTKLTGGLAQATIKAEGFWEAGATGLVDDDTFAGLAANAPWSIYPAIGETAAASAGYGSTCYFTDGIRSTYKFGEAVGEPNKWTGEVSSQWPLVRGVSIHPPGTARTATANGTGVQHLAVTSGQYVYGALHVLSISGTSTPTITVKVQSDSDNTWASPTDRITFAAKTAVGGEILRTAGAITDTWWRVAFTISGSSPSFLFITSLGIF